MMARFCGFITKVFDFKSRMAPLQDSRLRPQIPTSAIWGRVFFLFVLRQRSLNAMEYQMRQPQRRERLIGKKKPSADRVGQVLGRIDPDQLRRMLSGINHQVGRNKALRNDWPFRVGAIDGHEFFFQPPAMLPAVFPARGAGQKTSGGGILSPRRGLPSDRVSHRPAFRRGNDSPRRRGSDCGQKVSYQGPSFLAKLPFSTSA